MKDLIVGLLEQHPNLLMIITTLTIILFIAVVLLIGGILYKVVKGDLLINIKWLGIHIAPPETAPQLPNPYSKEELLKFIEGAPKDLKSALVNKITRDAVELESSAGLIYFNPNSSDPTSQSRKDIHDRIKAALTAAKTIKIMLATAGPVFVEAESILEHVVKEKLQRIVAAEKRSVLEREQAGHFQLLLLDPEYHDAIEKRGGATRTDMDMYRNQILSSIQHMKSYMNESGNIQLRLYRHMPQWKLFLCDNQAFVQFYSSGKTGLQSPLYVFDIENSNSLGPVFCQIFETIWEGAERVTGGQG